MPLGIDIHSLLLTVGKGIGAETIEFQQARYGLLGSIERFLERTPRIDFVRVIDAADLFLLGGGPQLLTSIARFAPNVTRIDLGSHAADECSDGDVLLLARACRNVTEFVDAAALRLSLTSVRLIAATWPRLERLTLATATFPVAPFAQSLTAFGPNLSHLHISHFTESIVPTDCFRLLVRALKSLNHLAELAIDLRGSSHDQGGLTEHHWRLLFTECPHIKTVFYEPPLAPAGHPQSPSCSQLAASLAVAQDSAFMRGHRMVALH
eukprot:jgi/Hompol1/5447/HPOL_001698-RA